MADKKLDYFDKFLPDQSEHTYHYKGNEADLIAALYQSIVDSSAIEDPLKKLKLTVTDKFTLPEMASNPIMLRFYELITRLINAKYVLEIGTFVGVSTMAFADGIADGGKVYTCEKFDHFADIARKNFTTNGYDKKIELIEGDAFENMDLLPKDINFDLIFIDGNKERYKDYFESLEPLLSPNGVIIVDDCFFHGDVYNDKPQTEKGQGTKDFLDAAAKRDDYVRLALPLSNGVYIMMKKS